MTQKLRASEPAGPATDHVTSEERLLTGGFRATHQNWDKNGTFEAKRHGGALEPHV